MPKPGFEKAALGVLAGMAATTLMTSAMTRLHARLPARQRYSLPPRQILGALAGGGAFATVVMHFVFGALAGGLFPLMTRRRGAAAGATYGGAVWAVSYLGWLPASGVLRPAWRHPPLRNGLMLTAHLIWGGALAAALRELEAAAGSAFAANEEADMHSDDR